LNFEDLKKTSLFNYIQKKKKVKFCPFSYFSKYIAFFLFFTPRVKGKATTTDLCFFFALFFPAKLGKKVQKKEKKCEKNTQITRNEIYIFFER
jgi:1,4-dihydroxy-2-naphthoate octaprenyltransferase